MTLREGYDLIGGDYEEVMQRMRNEGRIRKFAKMFLRDQSYPRLVEAMWEGDYDAAFRAAHTMKGVCKNLGFTNMGNSIGKLTEFLREKDIENAVKYLPEVEKEYQKTIEAVSDID